TDPFLPRARTAYFGRSQSSSVVRHAGQPRGLSPPGARLGGPTDRPFRPVGSGRVGDAAWGDGCGDDRGTACLAQAVALHPDLPDRTIGAGPPARHPTGAERTRGSCNYGPPVRRRRYLAAKAGDCARDRGRTAVAGVGLPDRNL